MNPIVMAALQLVIEGAIQLAKQAGATAEQIEGMFRDSVKKLNEQDPADLPDV